MTAEEIAAIKKRLEQSISTLEEQTQVLKSDLTALNTFLDKKENIDPTISQKISEQEEATRQQVEANQALLNELGEIDSQSATKPELISELEKRTINMLNRMQQKVSAKEIISNLYEEMQGSLKGSPIGSPQGSPKGPAKTEHAEQEVKQPEPKAIDPIEEAKQIRNEQEMEQTVKKMKDQDALDDLKKKLGLG